MSFDKILEIAATHKVHCSSKLIMSHSLKKQLLPFIQNKEDIITQHMQ